MFVKHASLFILAARFFVYLIKVDKVHHCSGLIHHFLDVLNTKEGVFFGGGGRDFHQKQINIGFHLNREIHATCLMSNLPDIPLALKFIKLNNFVCQTYHLSDNLKT